MNVYQNIVIDGKDIGSYPERKNSAFCNEGKWFNFINPLLPSDCSDMTFVELGCNAGMFLKLAKAKGFRNVVGYDRSKSVCKIAEKYRGKDDYKIVNKSIWKGATDFECEELPLSDYVLMSNFHYYINEEYFVQLVDKLRYKTRNCIIVSVNIEDRASRSLSGMYSVKSYFKDWKHGLFTKPPSKEGDPFPRDMWSINFESPLLSVDVDSIWKEGKFSHTETLLCKDVIKNDSIEDIKSLYYYQHPILEANKVSDYDGFVRDKINMLYDVKLNGIKKPIIVRSNGKLLDGSHRLLMLKEMGYKKVIVRIA